MGKLSGWCADLENNLNKIKRIDNERGGDVTFPRSFRQELDALKKDFFKIEFHLSDEKTSEQQVARFKADIETFTAELNRLIKAINDWYDPQAQGGRNARRTARRFAPYSPRPDRLELFGGHSPARELNQVAQSANVPAQRPIARRLSFSGTFTRTGFDVDNNEPGLPMITGDNLNQSTVPLQREDGPPPQAHTDHQPVAASVLPTRPTPDFSIFSPPRRQIGVGSEGEEARSAVGLNFSPSSSQKD